MRVLLDTCIVIDYLQQRSEFCENANAIFEYIKEGKFISYITVKSLTDIYYITQNITHNSKHTKQIIENLLISTTCLDSKETYCFNALDSNLTDYEDALLDETAFINDIDYIVTRNLKDFKYSKTKVISPKDFIDLFKR